MDQENNDDDYSGAAQEMNNPQDMPGILFYSKKRNRKNKRKKY